MELNDKMQDILKGYDYEIANCKILFFNTKDKIIRLKKDEPELFSELFNRMCAQFGSPVYVDAYYGFIWQADDKVLTLNSIEESYNHTVTTVYVLSKIPLGRKMKYAEYSRIEETVKQVFSDNNVDYCPFARFFGGKIVFFGTNDGCQCMLAIKQRYLEFYYSVKEPFGDGIRLIPRYVKKESITLSDLSTVKEALINCFAAKKE